MKLWNVGNGLKKRATVAFKVNCRGGWWVECNPAAHVVGQGKQDGREKFG